jgi:acyl carrier protein
MPDSFSPTPGARLYKTGDLSRYLPDGNIEFLGRNDQQIKIRGYRVEPGEIEAEIARHEAVREAAVVVHDDSRGGKRLVGYVVTHAQSPLTGNELRAYLRDRLPEYMIPATFMTLDEMPLTTSGKVDRRALPAPQQSRPDLDKQYAAPQNEIEQKIAAIWQEVLQVERVGIHDNFFDLGGHSLLILQMQGKLHEQLQSDLSMVEMFKHPTVHSLAERLMRREEEPEGDEPQGEKMIEQLQEGKGRLRQQLKHRQAAMRGSVLNG